MGICCPPKTSKNQGISLSDFDELFVLTPQLLKADDVLDQLRNQSIDVVRQKIKISNLLQQISVVQQQLKQPESKRVKSLHKRFKDKQRLLIVRVQQLEKLKPKFTYQPQLYLKDSSQRVNLNQIGHLTYQAHFNNSFQSFVLQVQSDTKIFSLQELNLKVIDKQIFIPNIMQPILQLLVRIQYLPSLQLFLNSEIREAKIRIQHLKRLKLLMERAQQGRDSGSVCLSALSQWRQSKYYLSKPLVK